MATQTRIISTNWRAGLIAVLSWLLFTVWVFAAESQSSPPLDENLALYGKTEPSGVIAELQRQLDTGKIKFPHHATNGYLDSILRELKVPPSSQMLVASKTSPNKDLISPKNPRALYFNQSVYVAYVPGAPLLEIAAADPRLGVVFYTLDQSSSKPPHFQRDNRCLECHASSKTMNVPGFLVRSFLTKADGEVDILSGLTVDDRTPIADRWGGFYVTGTHGSQPHRGNLFGATAIAKHTAEPLSNGNLVSLNSFLSTAAYPESGSDIVALLVMEHQAHMQNLFARITATAAKSSDIHAAYPEIEAALQYLLFTEEATLRDPIHGTSTFEHDFAQQTPKDPTGRSLADFDLQTRLFKYQCSYMIYSSAFDALPPAAKAHFYHRLWQILSGTDTSPQCQRVTPENRKAIREILGRTKTDLPLYWQL